MISSRKRFGEEKINERLRMVREKFEGARGKLRFARKIGESHSNISRYERGRTVPAHVLARVAEAYSVNPEWLLTGKGAMLMPTEADRVRGLELALPSAPRDREKLVGREELSDFYVLPLLRDPTAAGPGRRITDEDVEGPAIIHRAWCPHPDTTDYVRVRGDSMEPVIPDGSIVTIDKSYSNPEELIGQVVAIYIAETEEVTIRRLQKDAVKPRCYIGVPDNAGGNNRPVVLTRDDRVIGRVVSVHALVR